MIKKKINKNSSINKFLKLDSKPEYGSVINISPKIRKIMASNSSPFTLHGTGTYIVGKGSVAVIDPGPYDKSHIQAILNATKGEKVSHIFITHTHLDHSPAASLLKEATGSRTYGFGKHGLGNEELSQDDEGADHEFTPDYYIADKEKFYGAGWTLTGIHTPGHTSNHVCYSFIEENVMFTGDHVMGWSTTVVSPPDGNMGDYIKSLKKLLERNEVYYYPTHGPKIENPQNFVRALISHRKMRETQLINRLKKGAATIDEMIPDFYASTNSRLWPAAARSLLALLNYLQKKNMVSFDGSTNREAKWYYLK